MLKYYFINETNTTVFLCYINYYIDFKGVYNDNDIFLQMMYYYNQEEDETPLIKISTNYNNRDKEKQKRFYNSFKAQLKNHGDIPDAFIEEILARLYDKY
jgi:hypothetical protein